MLTDEELIDGLRGELKSLRPPADLIDRLREQPPADRHPRRDGLERLDRGWTPIVRSVLSFAALVASGLVVLAVGALVLVAHHGPDGRTPSNGPARRSSGVPTLAQLTGRFSVLRRAQGAADRSVRAVCPDPCSERLVPGLTRVARTMPDGSKVLLSVWRLKTAQAGAPAGSFVLDEVVQGPKDPAIVDPASLPESHVVLGGALLGIPSADVAPRVPLWIAAVPDGVKWVRWTFVCTHGQSCEAADSRPLSVDVNVVNNVAAARVLGTGGGERGAGRAEWYDGDGRLLGSFSTLHKPTTPFLSSNPTNPTAPLPERQASPKEILAFLANARHGTKGAFSLTYEMRVAYGHGLVRRITVTAAQASANMFVYRETPSLALTGPGGHALSHSYEVFRAGRPLSNAGPGLYSCSEALPWSPWACQGPYTGIGMGGINELVGAYPPQALERGLENAAEAFTGLPAPPATRPTPAFLLTQPRSTPRLRCLVFGSIATPDGSVCLTPNGTIATYNLPQSAYRSATLLAYGTHLPSDAFTLPARPTQP
jgi:hypothetical protein